MCVVCAVFEELEACVCVVSHPLMCAPRVFVAVRDVFLYKLGQGSPAARVVTSGEEDSCCPGKTMRIVKQQRLIEVRASKHASGCLGVHGCVHVWL